MPDSKIPLLVATTNKKKLKELTDLLYGLPYQLLTLKDLPSYQEVEEDGTSFEENAVKKALGYAKQSGHLTLGEDSGLCCEVLEGAPGIFSARFAGLHATDDENNQKLLKLFEKIPDNCRMAYYQSTIAIALPGKVIGTSEGKVHGYIHKTLEGNQGFGYDPLFYFPPFQTTFGCVSSEQKHSVSHRSKSLAGAKKILQDYSSKHAVIS